MKPHRWQNTSSATGRYPTPLPAENVGRQESRSLPQRLHRALAGGRRMDLGWPLASAPPPSLGLIIGVFVLFLSSLIMPAP